MFSEDEGKCKNTAVGKLLEITNNNVDCYGAKIIIRICQFFTYFVMLFKKTHLDGVVGRKCADVSIFCHSGF